MGIDQKQQQSEQDKQHLGLLTIFNYVYAAILAAWSLIWVLYILFGVMMVVMPSVAPAGQPTSSGGMGQSGTVPGGMGSSGTAPSGTSPGGLGPSGVSPGGMGTGGGGTAGAPPPMWIPGAMVIAIGALSTLFYLAGAAVTAACAWCLSLRQGRVFCLIVSGFNCLHMPLGTMLGVFTIIVLVRESVREMFEDAARGRITGDERDSVRPPIDAAPVANDE